jgi:hypothetical protein
MTHAFKSKFEQEVKNIKELDCVSKVERFVVSSKLMEETFVLKVLSEDNNKIANIISSRFDDNLIIRNVSGEVICIKKKDKEKEIKVLSKILKSS